MTLKVKCINCGYEITHVEGGRIELYEAAHRAAVARMEYNEASAINQACGPASIKVQQAEADFAKAYKEAQNEKR